VERNGPSANRTAATAEPPPLPANTVGEVVVRGRCVFEGYEPRDHLGFDPNAAALLPGGWLRTGDSGWLDDRGYLHLSGRLKEVINRAGEKISPLVGAELLALRRMLAFTAHA
jgi:acyl-CoA synthetase (AMP-forming)/AMP-acid ligase II